MGYFGGQGILPSLKGAPTNYFSLAAGETFALGESAGTGAFAINSGLYAAVQQQDPITNIWRTIGGGDPNGSVHYMFSDGVNYRLANQTGCAVGALITNAGTGYTSAPAVAATAGSSIWKAIVGGAVNTTVTVSNGGSNYTYPPIIQFSAPPAGGIQATGHATLSGGAVSTIVVDDQGAGYSSPPTITIINDPREGINNVTQGYNAAAVCLLTGSGTITGLLCIDHGTPLTAVPTLSFSGGGGSAAAATAIMCWSITGVTVGTAGTGFTGPSKLSGLDAFPTTAAIYKNGATQSGLVKIREANILLPESGGALTATGLVIYDGGIYTSVPTPLITTNGALITASGVVTFAMGGQTGGAYVTPV